MDLSHAFYGLPACIACNHYVKLIFWCGDAGKENRPGN